MLSRVKKKLVVLLDADGSIYNKYHRLMMLYLLSEHENSFSKKLSAEESDVKVEQILSELVSLIQFDSKEGKVIWHGLAKKEFLKKLETEKNIQGNDNINARLINLIQVIYSNSDSGDSLFQGILFLANQPLFSKIKETLIQGGFDEFEMGSCSNRQTPDLDVINCVNNGTGRFEKDIQLIVKQFNLFPDLPIKCSYVDLTIPDLYKKYFDRSKISIFMSVLEKYASSFDGEISIYAFDDKKQEIIDPLARFYSKNRDLIWQKIKFFLMEYAGDFLPNYILPVTERSKHLISQNPSLSLQGTGQVCDGFYSKNVKRLIAACHQLFCKQNSSNKRFNQFYALNYIESNDEILQSFKEARVCDDELSSNNSVVKNSIFSSSSSSSGSDADIEEIELKFEPARNVNPDQALRRTPSF